MLKINFEKTTNWYQGIEFEGSHLVTKANHNKDLGISSIRLSAPRGTVASVLASVIVYMTNGMEVYGTVYSKKDGSGLTFNTEQREFKRADETTGYADINVRVPMSIQAQILRFAETKTYTQATQAPTPQAPVQQAPVQENYAHPAQTQAPAPVAPAQTQPANGGLLDQLAKSGTPLTADQVQALIAAGQL